MTSRDFNSFSKEIDRRMEREEMERGYDRYASGWIGTNTTPIPPTFPNDERRPNVGPPKMMRCG